VQGDGHHAQTIVVQSEREPTKDESYAESAYSTDEETDDEGKMEEHERRPDAICPCESQCHLTKVEEFSSPEDEVESEDRWNVYAGDREDV
jgi:hypothetical protein